MCSPARWRGCPAARPRGLRSPLELGRLALTPLERAPLELLEFWRAHSRGHLVINPLRHEYLAGVQPVGRSACDAVAWIAAHRLLAEPGLAEPLASLLDHLLGSDGQPDGLRLSDGGGRTPAWADVGQRLRRQFSLGYAPPEAAASPVAYFTWGLRGYLAAAPDLTTADPGLERLLRSSLFDSQIWRRQQG
ncbi:MAG: hypothetical protein V9H69_06855 [Anaerolineae bacterium]